MMAGFESPYSQVFVIHKSCMFSLQNQVVDLLLLMHVSRDEKQQLLLGIRRANRQSANLSSSVLSSDSIHIGILAAAAHAMANNSPFTVFYNPRSATLLRKDVNLSIAHFCFCF